MKRVVGSHAESDTRERLVTMGRQIDDGCGYGRGERGFTGSVSNSSYGPSVNKGYFSTSDSFNANARSHG